MQEVPVGSFFCFECSDKGSTAQLEEYFQKHENRKFEDPIHLLDSLLHDDTKETQALLRGSLQSPKEAVFPRSELDWIHRKDAQCLVGKPVRLFCPHGNNYHNGRIVDIRPCKTDTEVLVRFPAGKDYRKTPLTTWLRLEEHCCAVATKIVWGIFPNKQKDKNGRNKSSPVWEIAKLWSRTARELVPVMHLLDPKQGQIRCRKPVDQRDDQKDENGEKEEEIAKPSWGLVESFGTDTWELLNLVAETKDSPPPSMQQQKQQHEGEAEIMLALANAERGEQERVRKWKQLSLLNPIHKAAIRCQDEYALGTLGHTARSTHQRLRPSPLIPQGLDRFYLVSQVSQRIGVVPTKDMASSLTCEMVQSVPETIEMITLNDRNKSSVV